ncbi:MAG: NUDIX hydrolase [Planctomycetota bacterium]|jgi:ADP-ribose pyrophosphatase YjhB (NUDIX family)
MDPKWLEWAKRLQAIAQNGLTFAEDHFDVERYEQVRQLDLFVREKDYATPKVDVRGAAFRDGGILLVKECSDGKWTLPGGWADVGESPSESVEREVREESGFTVKAERLAAIYDRSKHPHKPLMHYHLYKLFFICEITGGQPTTSNETEEVAFFDEDKLPELSATKILPEQIARMFEYYRRPELRVTFSQYRDLPTYPAWM